MFGGSVGAEDASTSHPLQPDSFTDDDDFVVVSGSSSPDSSTAFGQPQPQQPPPHGGSLARGHHAGQPPPHQARNHTHHHHPPHHHPSAHHHHHHHHHHAHHQHHSGHAGGSMRTPARTHSLRWPTSTSPLGTSPVGGGAVAAMAAVAAAGWQAVATVARSVQHSSHAGSAGASQSAPKPGGFFHVLAGTSPRSPAPTSGSGTHPAVAGSAAGAMPPVASTSAPSRTPGAMLRAHSAAVAAAAAPAAPSTEPVIDDATIAKLLRLPDASDAGDLSQRVAVLLMESARQRSTAAANAELDAAEAADAEGCLGGPAGAAQRRRAAQQSAGATPAQLLALHRTCAALLAGAVPHEQRSSGGGGTQGAPPPPRPSALRIDSTAAPTLAAPLQLRARALLASLNAGNAEAELLAAVAADAGGAPLGAPSASIPSAVDVILDSASRYACAAAADELLDLLPSSVDGYARAADLLLFLLVDVPGVPAAVKPPGYAGDRSGSTFRQYVAVKVRQAVCMAALNAQLARKPQGSAGGRM
eukprot:239698-Chlamydomonas_euryale.AAC.1